MATAWFLLSLKDLLIQILFSSSTLQETTGLTQIEMLLLLLIGFGHILKQKNFKLSTNLGMYEQQQISKYSINIKCELPQFSSSIWLLFCSLNMLSTTWISVAVDSSPQNAAQSLTTSPAPITSDPLLIVPAQSGTCSKLDNQSSCSTVVWGWTRPPLLLRTQQVPTSMLLAMELRNTSTPRVSAIISSVYLSRSGWIKATQSLQAMQLPNADSFYYTLTTLTFSDKLFLMLRSSLSVVLLGTSSPFLLPAVVLPTIRVPPIVVCTTGMNDPSSLSNTLQKLQEPPEATKQYPLVSLAKTPISLEFSYCTLFAIILLLIIIQKLHLTNINSNHDQQSQKISVLAPPHFSSPFQFHHSNSVQNYQYRHAQVHLGGNRKTQYSGGLLDCRRWEGL